MVIELDGKRVLTDPVLRDRVTVLRRVAPPSAPDVDEVDAILISHVHYDHLDLPSLRQFDPATPVLVPRGAARHLRALHLGDVREIACGDEVRLGPVTVHATFADHDARRRPFGRAVPSLGYLVTGGVSVYFAGDTDVFDGMADIASDLDVALVPIAGWGPRVPSGHLDPVRAAEALTRLKPRVAVPIHWGTYRRFDLRTDPASLWEPAHAFERDVRRVAPDVDVAVLPPGGTLEIEPRALGPVRTP